MTSTGAFSSNGTAVFRKALELFENGENASPDTEQVLTLVTCSYEWDGARNIVVAVRD